jgi:hypothetical protein
VPEASGIAAGRKNPGVLWTINDSGLPQLIALDDRGAIIGRVRVPGALVEDWEDVSVGACPAGSCIYIADIGDNNARRPRVTIYRVPEPDPKAPQTARAEAMPLAYPDRPQDAEAMFVTADQQIVIITKGASGPIAVYRAPGAFQAAATPARLERVAALSLSGGKGNGKGNGDRVRVTDADASPDAQWVAVRTHDQVLFYQPGSLLSRTPRETLRADIRAAQEPQGEGVTVAAGGVVYLVGEGTGTAGTFVRMQCRLAGGN